MMSEQIKAFAKYLLVQKGLGKITIYGYCNSIKRVLRSLDNLSPNNKDIYDYIEWMHSKEYSYSHIVNTSLAIESYMKHIGKYVKIGRPRKPKTIVKNTLTEAQIVFLIANTKNIREKAMITLLAYSGIRNKEFCNLKVQDIDLGNNILRVISGKNKKDYVVCISGECSNILSNYLKEYSRPSDEYLFTSLVRKTRYSEWSLRKLIKILAKRAGINKRVYPHLIRHSLASNLLKRGANIVTIQKQLGHSRIDSTMIYLRSFPLQVQAEYNLFVPSYL